MPPIEEVVSGPQASVEKPANDFVLSGEDETKETTPGAPAEEPPKAPEGKTTEEEDSANDEQGDDQPSQDPKKPKRGGFQKKLAKAQAEAEFWKEQALNGGAKSTEPKEQVSEKTVVAGLPKEEDFESWSDYQKALTDYNVKQEFARRDAQAEAKGKIERYNSAKVELQKQVPDYEDILEAYDGPFTDAMHVAILDSDIGPEITLHIAQNPELGKRMAKMGILHLNREIAKIETTIQLGKISKQEPPKAAVNTTPKAPPPIKPVGNSTGNVLPADVEDNFESYKAARKAGKI